MLPLRPHILSLDPDALGHEFVQRGWERFRAEQVLKWVYQGILDPGAMRNIPSHLREGLLENYDFGLPRVLKESGSHLDRSTKLALRLGDGRIVECVHLQTPRLHTLCVSSQVGCAIDCQFCATGRMGLLRNLEAWEIVVQVLMLRRRAPDDRHVNVVFMGMGEPMANYDRVMTAVRRVNDPRTLALGARHITVSTSGLVPGIRKLAREGIQVNLAISLNATTDEQRDAIMPINKRWPIAELMAAATFYTDETGRGLTFEYVLLGGVNDTMADARRLSQLTREIPHKINLINWNPTPGVDFHPSQRPEAFLGELLRRGHKVLLRYSQGKDVNAACGQLGADLLSRSAAAPR